MTIDLRLTRSLPEDFYNNNADMGPLAAAPYADLNGDHQLGAVDVNQDGRPDIQEAEFALYLSRLNDRLASPQSTDAQRQETVQLLANPQACLESFVREKRGGRLGNIEQEARAWLQHADQVVQSYLSGLELSLQSYEQLPQTFRDHIAPNYFRNLAKAAGSDADHNGTVSIEELKNVIRQEVQGQIQSRTRENEATFREIDANHDEKIDLAEFRRANQATGDSDNARIEEAFNRFDTDHNHELSLAEFQARIAAAAPSEEDYQREAQALLMRAQTELAAAQQRLGRNLENYQEIDRLSSRLSVFELSTLDQLPTQVCEGNDLFRVLTWMRTQMPPGQTQLTNQRADELLEARVMDTRPMMTAIARLVLGLRGTAADQIRADLEVLRGFMQRFQAFSRHGILTEEDLRTRILVSPLSLREVNLALGHLLPLLQANGVPNEAIAELGQSLEAALQPWNALAGADQILSREDVDRLLAKDRLRIVLRTIQSEVHESEISEILNQTSENIQTGRETGDPQAVLRQVGEQLRRRGIASRRVETVLGRIREELRKTSNLQDFERPHFLDPLWTKFHETRNENPDARVYPLSNPTPFSRIEGNKFLARALIQYAYLNPTNVLQIIQDTERRELFYLLEHVVARGLHDRARSHAGDGIPGVLHYVTYPVHWLGGYTWRERVAHHADEAHQARVQAIQALRAQLEGSSDRNLREAIGHLENPEHRRILTEELHATEVERIYHIPNSREQEEAYIRFATYTLRGRVNSENGIIEGFRQRFSVDNIHSAGDVFLNQWQQRNGPAARTVYDRLASFSEHAHIANAARAAQFDLMGNGGDLNPLHWGHEASDAEESLDGIWDTLGQQALISGILAGVVMGGRFLLGMGGSFNASARSAEFWRGSISRPVTAVEFAQGWRNHPNIFAKGAYWLVRGVCGVLSLPLSRELNAAEVEIVNANAIRLARRTSWSSRLSGFFFNLWGNLEVNRLIPHRSTQEAGARILRLSQIMLREAEVSFTEANALTQEAQRLSGASSLTAEQLTTIETNLRRAADLSRQGHALRQLAMHQRNGLGVLAGESNAYTGLQRSLTGAEGIPGLIENAQRARTITGAADIGQSLRNIRLHLDHLKQTQDSLLALMQHQRNLMARGALAGAGLYGLAQLSENVAASRAAARMINPALVAAQNPLAHGGQWNLYFLAWISAHDATLSDEYRDNPTLQEWALENGISGLEMSPDQLQGAYTAHRHYRGSRAVYREAFLNPVRERNEREPLRQENLEFPTTGIGAQNAQP